MKSLFNSQILRKKPNQTNGGQEEAPAAPTFYHLPPTGAPASNDPYSHTANSTAGYAHASAYPSLPSQNPPRERPSLIDRIEAKTTNLLGSVVGEDHAVSLAHRVNTTVSNGRDARELLRNGAIVQFVSKNSGHLLQVVMSTQNTLTFDGCGAANAFNTYFTVEECGGGRLRFHNSYNYLAFHEKQPSILTVPPGPKNVPNIEFRVHNIVGTNELVAFESYAYKNCFICIAADGLLKTSHIKDKTIEAQFSVVPIPLFQLPTQVGPRQPFGPSSMSPYGSLPLQNASPPVSSQPPPYSVEPSAPPAPSSSSTSSSLYPKFN